MIERVRILVISLAFRTNYRFMTETLAQIWTKESFREIVKAVISGQLKFGCLNRSVMKPNFGCNN